MTLYHAHCRDIECDGCAASIQRSLGKVSGVESVQVLVNDKDVIVRFDPAQTDERALFDRLTLAGFPPDTDPGATA